MKRFTFPQSQSSDWIRAIALSCSALSLSLLGSFAAVRASESDMPHSHDAPSATEAMPHDGHGDHGSMDHGGHSHGTLEVAAGQPVPTVDLIIHPDAQRGWNLEVQVEHFSFAPTTVNESNTQTEGHAHIYINGEKLTRLYGSWYYLESLPPGQHIITVSLNSNTHNTLTVQGQPIQDSEVIWMVPPQRGQMRWPDHSPQ